jgi:hypothetical protein
MTQPYDLTTANPQWETCDHCQAPLDERQRYCVACGARRSRSDDPVARYFVAAERSARASQVPAPAPSSRPQVSWAVAVALALVPVATALGVIAGRGGAEDDALLLQALKAQKAPVVNVGSATGTTETAAATPSTSEAKSKKASKGDDPNDADGKVIARTEYGSARSLTDSTVTEAQKEESKKALEHIVNAKGKEYVEQQRNLPDQIVIP